MNFLYLSLIADALSYAVFVSQITSILKFWTFWKRFTTSGPVQIYCPPFKDLKNSLKKSFIFSIFLTSPVLTDYCHAKYHSQNVIS